MKKRTRNTIPGGIYLAYETFLTVFLMIFFICWIYIGIAKIIERLKGKNARSSRHRTQDTGKSKAAKDLSRNELR
jgi:hypothetical protein